MNYMLCPVCGDKVVNGKCSFCGYELTAEEKRNAKYGSTNEGVTLNQSKNASNQSINDCKNHTSHNINNEINNIGTTLGRVADTLGDNIGNAADKVVNSITGTNSNAYNNTNRNYNNSSQYSDKNLETLRIIAIVTIFFSQVISIIICVIGMRSAADEFYRNKFKTILFIDIAILCVGFVFTMIAAFLPLIFSIF